MSLTLLPMGHALVPSLIQSFATACLEEVRLATKVEGIAYLDDWLLFDRDPRALRRAVDLVRASGVTIDEDMSVLNPTHKLVYLGFKIDTVRMTIQLTLSAHDRLVYLPRYTRQGSLKDRQRISGYPLQPSLATLLSP